ncbi:TIM barrel protein [Bacteroidota bacterium]
MKKLNSRRDFLKISGAGALGMLALSPLSYASVIPDRKSFNVGLQLYSIRDAMAKDPLGSLKKVSDIGYKYLELADYSRGKFYGFAPAELKKIASDLGMEVLSSHTNVEAKGVTLDNAKKMANDHAELGVKFLVQPWVNPEDRTIEKYKQMIEEWNKVANITKDLGIQFGYHNHNFEFATVDGIVPYYDLFLKDLDPDLVTMEIDLYWVSKAGQDPVKMFEKYPGRFQLFHMKDKAVEAEPIFEVQKDDITSVGSGLIDFKRILAAKKKAGFKYMFVEDDNQGNGKPFEGIDKSISNLTSKILV